MIIKKLNSLILDNDGLQQRLYKVDSELILGEAKVHLKKLANV